MSSSTERQLKSLMHHFGVYTDDALGKALGVTPSAVSQWRNDRGIPEKILNKYSKVFDEPSSTNEVSQLKEEINVLQKQVIELQQEIIKLQKNK